jgi:drug/metabolite transporter (DMT)-like permease
MSNSSLGIGFALCTLVLWSLTPFFFRATGRLIGPFATNLLRLSIAFPVLLAFSAVQFWGKGGAGLPTAGTAVLLALSGVIGLCFGDLLLYRALFRVGPERSSLLMTLAPAVAAGAAWIALDEFLSPAQLAGMTLMLGGVVWTVWKPAVEGGGSAGGKSLGRWRGAVDGIGAALCQGFSSVMAREAFLGDAALSPLYATAVRVGAGAVAVIVIARGRGTLVSGWKSLRAPHVLPRIVMGTFSGPIFGMTCYIAAMKFQPAGVVTTITFMTPLLVMPLGAWRYGTRPTGRMLAGGLAALAGVVLLGWNP